MYSAYSVCIYRVVWASVRSAYMLSIAASTPEKKESRRSNRGGKAQRVRHLRRGGGVDGENEHPGTPRVRHRHGTVVDIADYTGVRQGADQVTVGVDHHV